MTSHNENRARLNTIGLHTIVCIIDVGVRIAETQFGLHTEEQSAIVVWLPEDERRRAGWLRALNNCFANSKL